MGENINLLIEIVNIDYHPTDDWMKAFGPALLIAFTSCFNAGTKSVEYWEKVGNKR